MNCRKLAGILMLVILALKLPPAGALAQDVPMAGGRTTLGPVDSPPSLADTTVDQSPWGGGGDANFGQPRPSGRWSASADFLMLYRLGGNVNQELVSTAPHPPQIGPSIEVLNADQLHPSFSDGPRVGLTYHGDDGFELEALYFQTDGRPSVGAVGPDAANWLVMTAPGGFFQTQDYDDQLMAWTYRSRLYNGEFNVRWNPSDRLTMLAGFRWTNLSEDLQGTLPPERSTPFWETKTRNNLYGFQIGGGWKIVDRGRFSINAVGKAGIFDNCVDEMTNVSIYRVVYPESASTNHAAFVGEIDLECRYQVSPRLSLKLAYQALWLEGVALAPGQIQETYSNIAVPVYVQALGIDSRSGVVYQGVTAGIEYAF